MGEVHGCIIMYAHVAWKSWTSFSIFTAQRGGYEYAASIYREEVYKQTRPHCRSLICR